MKNAFHRHAARACLMLCLGTVANHHSPVFAADPPVQSLKQANPAGQWAVGEVMETLKFCPRAGEALIAGRIDDATSDVKACSDAPDLSAEARSQLFETLSGLYLASRNAPAALDAMRKAMALIPTPTDRHWMSLAMIYLANGRPDGSLAALDRIKAAHLVAGDLDPASDIAPAYYMTRGTAYLAARKYPDAVAAFDNAVRNRPGNAIVYWYRAMAYEAQGNTGAARSDYVEFARWALDAQVEPAMADTLASLGIDPAQERRHPFGEANPLQARAQATLDVVREAMTTVTTTQGKAFAYGALSTALDDLGQRQEALAAIDQALALLPDDPILTQSKVTTLFGMGRIDEAIRMAKPFSDQIAKLDATKAKPAAYSEYAEVAQTLSRAYRSQRKWKASFDALAAYAKGADVAERDYAATTYLYLRAKAGDKAPVNADLDAYIRNNTTQIPTSYRRGLLLYVQGKIPIEQVYWQAVLSGDAVSIHNALAETWFIAAAYQRYVKHDEAAAQTYLQRLDDLQPIGTLEWIYAKNNDV
ncbi:hypothetical protein PPN31114_00455 [Pandoraea pneumonica]|uniref:Beta-barrel assembly-enhancing protease n=1 Tax=Pandoraea pneumonica TaxID=2508299 RepID=A0A5E4RXK7_9BURK|nr:tetratricopeptide repeat protein [Pandoraea pneumonica]VVD68007.1 hypothetical protein PPN31114_00455 [Pandoraea pneumonica]